MTIWSELIGFKAPAGKSFPKVAPLSSPCPQLLFGMELEIENVPHWPDMLVPGMDAVEDGSLRNNGREFLVKPMTYSNLLYCLELFFGKNKLEQSVNYSDRCSIHVHTNCLNLTIEQIQTICFLYQVFEGVLFAWVGDEREENIFCTPWSQTNLSFKVFSQTPNASMFKTWQKYTALNLLPLYRYGTIEWRHLGGTCDLKKITTWLQLISSIYAYATANPLDKVKEELLALNTNSQYTNIVYNVFKELTPELTKAANFDLLLEDGVINMKYALSSNGEKAKSEFNAMEYTAAIEQLRARNPGRFNWTLDPALDAAPRAANPFVVYDDLQIPRQEDGNIPPAERTF